MQLLLKYLLAVMLVVQATRLSAQAVAVNKPAKNTARFPIPTGPSVVGVFDGRSPCQEIASEIKASTIPECIKIKWRLTLFQDSITKAPTRYILEGFVYRNPSRQGVWRFIHGTRSNPNALVVQLDPDNPPNSIYLYKPDDNVLFFLDHEKNPMPGNENFSYILYRTEN